VHYVKVIAVLINFHVVLQTVINFKMLSIGGQWSNNPNCLNKKYPIPTYLFVAEYCCTTLNVLCDKSRIQEVNRISKTILLYDNRSFRKSIQTKIELTSDSLTPFFPTTITLV